MHENPNVIIICGALIAFAALGLSAMAHESIAPFIFVLAFSLMNRAGHMNLRKQIEALEKRLQQLAHR